MTTEYPAHEKLKDETFYTAFAQHEQDGLLTEFEALKRKADLADELVALLQEATGFIEAWAQMHGKKPHLLEELNEALTKAKTINGE